MLARRPFIKRSAVGLATAALPALAVPALILYADGVTDDSAALQAWLDGNDSVVYADGTPVGCLIRGARFRLNSSVRAVRTAKPRCIRDSFFWYRDA